MTRIADGEIVKYDEDKRLVFGWASIIKDTEGKVLVDRQEDFIDSEDELEKAAYEYVLKSRDGGEMHIRKGVSTMVESVVLSDEKQRAIGIPSGIVPTGWWVGFRVNDERVWNEVKKGGYIGFSVHGTGKRNEVEIEMSDITEVEKSADTDEADVVEYDSQYYTVMSKAVATYTASIIEKAKKKKNKVATVMGEFKRGKLKSSSGKPVTDPKQAMAIAISEQQRVSKYNKNHDPATGRFTSGGGGGGGKGKGGSKRKAFKVGDGSVRAKYTATSDKPRKGTARKKPPQRKVGDGSVRAKHTATSDKPAKGTARKLTPQERDAKLVPKKLAAMPDGPAKVQSLRRSAVREMNNADFMAKQIKSKSYPYYDIEGRKNQGEIDRGLARIKESRAKATATTREMIATAKRIGDPRADRF